ncbi:MAG: TlpA family protein disulfide reductase [Solirubrobacterales bacterium]|nr:TlpA family protein disulfide reductase [Solirubrobacterales bacterium]
MADEGRPPDGNGRRPERARFRPGTIYSLIVGLVFVAVVAVAGINLIRTEDSGVLGAGDQGDLPLSQFAVPDARSELSGDANIAQDDCDTSTVPCPEASRRTPACRVRLPGSIEVCDFFDRPLVLSFWFTRGGDCEAQEDVFESAYRRYRPRVNFLAINVRDDRSTVQDLISERGWTHPIGLDADGALSNLYRVGGCPTFLYAYPGGILQSTSIGELSPAQLDRRVDDLLADSRRREAQTR